MPGAQMLPGEPFRPVVAPKYSHAASVLERFLLERSDCKASERFLFYVDVAENRPIACPALAPDKELDAILAENALLSGVSRRLAMAIPGVIVSVLNNNVSLALEKYLAAADLDVSGYDAERFFVLGQNLAAYARNEQIFLYCKMEQISLLIDFERLDEAERMLEEYEGIVPRDEELARLRARLSEKRTTNAGAELL